MFWDLIQQCQIGQANSAASDAKFAAEDARNEMHTLKTQVQQLHETIERLSLATMAMAEILGDRLGVTSDEIQAKVQEIDLRDGKLDGRLRPRSEVCEKCGHSNVAHRRACLYCGEPIPLRFIEPSQHQTDQ